MTDLEWLECVEPDPMEDLLESLGRLTERKRRLFACGICRRNEGLVHDRRCMEGVGISERFAEGLADARDLILARNHANNSLARCREGWESARHARTGVYCACLDDDAGRWVQGNFRRARSVEGATRGVSEVDSDRESRRVEAGVFRELHGTPSRLGEFDASWLTKEVILLAGSIVADRTFGRMPELGVVLEAAGCRDAGVIEHCRSGAEHLLGCWILDGVLS